ncbi:MAG TPA: hypothetical protein VD926_15805 [Acidimicrobiales bacterium]|nr:hypothetical protein [Acidimicrobiales bacterium]
MRRLVATVLVTVAVATGCAGAGRPTVTEDTLGERRCSADGMVTDPLDSDGLPSPVARTRQQLVEAALSCDYRALGRLAREDQVDLRYEGDPMPVRQWREREHDATSILRSLAGILSLTHVRQDAEGVTEFVWPTAVEWRFADVAPGRERRDLRDVVGEEGIFGWAEAGGYSGWRVAIGPDGRWLRFWYGPVDGEYQ